MGSTECSAPQVQPQRGPATVLIIGLPTNATYLLVSSCAPTRINAVNIQLHPKGVCADMVSAIDKAARTNPYLTRPKEPKGTCTRPKAVQQVTNGKKDR